MSMITITLGRYFAGRFVFRRSRLCSIFMLLVLVDYIEMSGDVRAGRSFRITVAKRLCSRTQLLERMMPFCI